MKCIGLFLIVFFCNFPLFGWENKPEMRLEGVLKTTERKLVTKYPDGREEICVEKGFGLVTDEPITISRSISIGLREQFVQEESLKFIQVKMAQEFYSLLGRRVQITGRWAQPMNFFFAEDIIFEADLVEDAIWQQTHQAKTVLYEPSITKLQGTLYQIVTNDENRENSGFSLILALNEPVDVQIALPEDDLNSPEKGVREVEMIFNVAPPKNLWQEGIVVTGTLFSALTAHHHRRVLMEVKNWEPISLHD